MTQLFLKIEPIKGQSQDEKHKGELEIFSFSHGISLPIQPGTSNSDRTAGKADISEINISRESDSASPLLMEYCANATVIVEGILTVEREDASSDLNKVTYKFKDILISNYQISASSGVPSESFSLNFSSIEVTYNSQKQGSGDAGKNVFTWNKSTNAKK